MKSLASAILGIFFWRGREAENLNGHVTITMPFQQWFVVRGLGLAMIKLCTKFKISTLTHYKDMEGDKRNTEIGMVWGYGSLKVIGNI